MMCSRQRVGWLLTFGGRPGGGMWMRGRLTSSCWALAPRG
jgi:hypothetical protein